MPTNEVSNKYSPHVKHQICHLKCDKIEFSEAEIGSKQSISTPDYERIRAICKDTILSDNIDLTPKVFQESRRNEWPAINEQGMGHHLSHIYSRVQALGIPNALGAKITLPTSLNLEAWSELLTDSLEDRELFSYIQCGFPLGYMGPASASVGIPNHSSAKEFPKEVGNFIEKEIALGGVVGPMPAPPFKQWTHVSPLMSREKRDSSERRVIIDMTFPNPLQSTPIYAKTPL